LAEPDPLAALAAQLEELRGQVSAARAAAVRANARLDTEGAGGSLMALLQVKRLGERLDEAIAAGKLKPPPAPWWGDLGEDESRAQMGELREWVETWLRPHYAGYMPRIPQCWPHHPEAVWELSTLRAEHLRVYGDEDNRDLQGALDWLNRWLPGCLSRLAEVIKCGPGPCQRARRQA
jgi:hypothetical protein